MKQILRVSDRNVPVGIKLEAAPLWE